MVLLDTAKELFRAGLTIEQVRAELRGTVLLCGDFPTCSYVEEVVGIASKSIAPPEKGGKDETTKTS